MVVFADADSSTFLSHRSLLSTPSKLPKFKL